MTGNDVTWPQVTESDPEVTSFDWSLLEVAVEGRKVTYTVRFTCYKTVARSRRQSRDRKSRHVTSGDRSDREVTSFDRKSPGYGCRRLKTRVYCKFHFLQGCSSKYEAVTWLEITSHDLRWPEGTRKWHYLTGSHVEVAVIRKLAYTVHFTSHKGVAHRSKQSHVRMMSRDLRWQEVTRKWRH